MGEDQDQEQDQERISITTRLTRADYDDDLGGWRCPALSLPGAKVTELYMAGHSVDPVSYRAVQQHIRFKSPPSYDATATISLTAETLADARRWRKLKIVLPVVGTVVGAAIAAAGNYYSGKKPEPVGPKPPSQASAESFVSLMARTESDEPARSHLSLTFDGTTISGVGTSADGTRSWSYSGHLSGGHMVLADRSLDPKGIGFGVLLLESVAGDANVYVGTWRGNTCNDKYVPAKREIRQCKVVLVKTDKNGPAVRLAMDKYKGLFGPANCMLAPMEFDTPQGDCKPAQGKGM